jgi:hypothetical protein
VISAQPGRGVGVRAPTLFGAWSRTTLSPAQAGVRITPTVDPG